jgi:hypothetical protein
VGWLRIIGLAAAIAFIVWLVARLARPGELCRIEVRDRRVAMRGSIPGRSRAEIVDFIGSLDLPDGAEIRGVRDGSSVRFAFNAAVPDSARQRIRNFLMLRR